MGKSGARSSGPMGFFVPGWSTGGRGLGRSAAMLYQALGMRPSSRTYLTVSFMAFSLQKGRSVSRAPVYPGPGHAIDLAAAGD